MAAKLDMMPQTVPNRPMNGATEEMTARLGKPPSERVSSSRAARAIASEIRSLSSPTVSPGMRRGGPSPPAARLFVAGDRDRLERLCDRLAGAGGADGAAEAHNRNHPFDDQHPAPER